MNKLRRSHRRLEGVDIPNTLRHECHHRANRDQVSTPPPTRALGPQDRWLERMLAGRLGQISDVFHRDGHEDADSYEEKGENVIGCDDRISGPLRL